MKKVLIDLNKLSNLNCGLGQVALNFGIALSEANSDIELNFLVPEKYIGFFGNKIKYHTNKSIAKHLNSFDLWHSIHQEPTILPDKDTPLILTIHDLNFLEEKNPKKASKRLNKIQNIIDRTQIICFISEFSKKIALENLSLENKSTQVIYNGVNIINQEKAVEIDSEKFFFSIGVFKSKKNFHVLLPVMKNFPNHKLVIAGDTKGPYYKELKKLIKKEKLETQIVFPGIIDESEKTWLYRNCDAFLFPSLYEGFGLPVIEAMKNGVPVITSNKTSLPEIGGGHTFIFNEFDKITIKNQIEKGIATYKSNPNLKTQAVEYSNKFNWKNNADNYLKLFKSLAR